MHQKCFQVIIRCVLCALVPLLAMNYRVHSATTTPPINNVETIIGDMTLPHEGYPHGVPPTWEWAKGPEVNMGNNPGSFKAMTAWGQFYEPREGNPAKNTRVQIRSIQAYYLSKQDGKWHQLQNSMRVTGDAYVEDFSGDANKPADVRRENDGTISATAGGGYNFHFWPVTDRASINSSDIAGMFTTCQARLIVGNADMPDDRASARYILNMGGDYWASLTARWAPNCQNNNDIGIGRFKYVTVNWQAFNMCTVPADKLRQNPPPME